MKGHKPLTTHKRSASTSTPQRRSKLSSGSGSPSRSPSPPTRRGSASPAPPTGGAAAAGNTIPRAAPFALSPVVESPATTPAESRTVNFDQPEPELEAPPVSKKTQELRKGPKQFKRQQSEPALRIRPRSPSPVQRMQDLQLRAVNGAAGADDSGLPTTPTARFQREDRASPAMAAAELSSFEASVLDVLNRARESPPTMGDAVLDECDHVKKEYTKGNYLTSVFTLRYDENDPRHARDGTILSGDQTAYHRAHNHLQSTAAMGPLQVSRGMCLAARDHVVDMGTKWSNGHLGTDGSGVAQRAERYGRLGGRYIEGVDVSGNVTAMHVVVTLLVADGGTNEFLTTLLDPAITMVGLCAGPHATQESMIVIILAEGYVDSAMHLQDRQHASVQTLLARHVDGSLPCPGCKQPIRRANSTDPSDRDHVVRTTVFIGPRHWHRACVACVKCGTRLGNGTWTTVDGRPYCDLCK